MINYWDLLAWFRPASAASSDISSVTVKSVAASTIKVVQADRDKEQMMPMPSAHTNKDGASGYFDRPEGSELVDDRTSAKLSATHIASSGWFSLDFGSIVGELHRGFASKGHYSFASYWRSRFVLELEFRSFVNASAVVFNCMKSLEGKLTAWLRPASAASSDISSVTVKSVAASTIKVVQADSRAGT